jgi:hypothetical protein
MSTAPMPPGFFNGLLVDGEDLLHRAGPFQTILVLAQDEPDARDLVNREAIRASV